MNLSGKIKQYREELNISQEEMANKIYVPKEAIASWEDGKSYPDVQHLILLSVLFNVSLEDLVKDDLGIMEEKVTNKSLKNWAIFMGIFYFIGLFIGIPLLFTVGSIGWMVIGVSFAISFAAGLKVRSMNEKLHIHPFQEILFFVEKRGLDIGKSSGVFKNYWKENLMKYVSGGAFGGVVALILVGIARIFI